MFGRAVEAKKAALANQPSSKMSSNSASLGKQLFPSSSPNSAPGRPATVVDMMKRSRFPPTHPSGQSRPLSTPAASFQNKSQNSYRPPAAATNGKGLASFYNGAGSFKDEPINIVDDSPPRLPTKRSNHFIASSGVEFDEDDFSDDNTLDLDFQAPQALPTLPRPKPQTAPVNPAENLPTSDASVISWTQSSPSHYVHPAIRASSSIRNQTVSQTPFEAPPTASKRDFPHQEQSTTQPVKKTKRELPWKRRPEPEDDDVVELQETPAAAPTPAPKPKPIWDTTASAVKAQKKQLKTQSKSSGKPEVSAADMHEAAMSSTSTKKKAASIVLSTEQRHVKSLVVDKGASVFFTGPAGTGKSVLMRSIIQDLRKRFARDPDRLAVTASTGLAACNIGGITLHSFAGIGLGKEDVNTLVKKIRRNPKAKNRWLRTKVLIIDEISMVDGDLFDKLSQIGRVIRNNGRPWGGIQLVITGDFFQLPPVPESGKEAKFAFDAATWSNSIDHTIGLTEVFRQRDPEFANMLNEMRLGKISEKTIKNFEALSRPLQFDDGIQVTELFPRRNEVERSNQKRLEALPGEVRRYEAFDTGNVAVRDKLLANMMAPPTIELKKKAQVMLIKNMDETLVNGTLGTVEKFMTQTSFELEVGEDDDGDMDAKKRIRAFTNALGDSGSKGDQIKYPLVRFQAADGTARHILCVPEEWKVELPTGEVQASRKQLPLILAWALSIHKAQGQTLERVKVDLGTAFEKGQAYVALSRATTQQGLQVLRFRKDKVMAHPRVVDFYNKLYSVETVMGKRATTSASAFDNFVYNKPPPAQTAAGQRRAVYEFDEDEEEMMAAYA
ncbi:ATP-dependent DNA helicase PIF1 [Podospora fimiseda]|uniref:ATP-dependent DNA helicase PIF1 n=1 Tax=Podospora fimiseda TaxID=252190 RepID=A0AAN7BLM5_9PEZI|nr:ATP-dependent DNA helicase PIF1 [Podospora fimiseda]